MGRILKTNSEVMRTMTHLTQLTRGSRGHGNSKTPTYPGWGPKGPGPSSPYAGVGGQDDSNIAHCIHQPFAECYAVQAFSIASNLDPKLMPNEHDQIMMRTVCTVIQSLVSRLPNNHSSHSKDRKKHHTLLTLKHRINIVHDVNTVEQHELLGADASRPLLDATPEGANSLALIQGVQSRFFYTTATVGTIRLVYHARSVSPVVEGQHISSKPPGERELSCSRSSSLVPIPLRANLLQQPAEALYQKILNGTHH